MFGLLKITKVLTRSLMADLKNEAGSRQFNFKKVLVVSKVTRYESSKEFAQNNNNNNDYNTSECNPLDANALCEKFRKAYLEHHKYEKMLMDELKKIDTETQLIKRSELKENHVKWADMVISLGGDGTLLMTANKIGKQNVPFLGINSNPDTSLGQLCLPGAYTNRLPEVLANIRQGKFNFRYRTRIRVTLTGQDALLPPIHLHQKSWVDNDIDEIEEPQEENDGNDAANNVSPSDRIKSLPSLVLNDVYIGEKLSARVSYLDVKVDEKSPIFTKSSGICICTGSGSSAWNYSINKISVKTVNKLMEIAKCKANAEEVANEYNKQLIYNPDDARLCYTFRDLIPSPKVEDNQNIETSGFANQIVVQSRCHDACLVLDGGFGYSFNAGTTAILQVCPGDALKTIDMQL